MMNNREDEITNRLEVDVLRSLRAHSLEKKIKDRHGVSVNDAYFSEFDESSAITEKRREILNELVKKKVINSFKVVLKEAEPLREIGPLERARLDPIELEELESEVYEYNASIPLEGQYYTEIQYIPEKILEYTSLLEPFGYKNIGFNVEKGFIYADNKILEIEGVLNFEFCREMFLHKPGELVPEYKLADALFGGYAEPEEGKDPNESKRIWDTMNRLNKKIEEDLKIPEFFTSKDHKYSIQRGY